MRGRGRLLTAAAVVALLVLAGCGGSGSEAEQAQGNGSMTGMDMGSSAPMAGMAMAGGDGLSATMTGYTLELLKTPDAAGKAGKLTFQITDAAGGVHKEFTVSQTKLLHLYLVRADLTGFQHVHPTLDTALGVWSVDLTVPQPGPYHVVAEFAAVQPDHTTIDYVKLGGNFTVKGKYAPTPFTPDLGPWTVDGYTLSVSQVGDSDLKLKFTRDDSDVTDLQPYLGSFAHLTGFHQGDLKTVHVHPNEFPSTDASTGGPVLTLTPVFTESGTYRMFVEFQTGGTVHLVPIDIAIAI